MKASYHISINNAGKKFGKEWIFRKVNLEILQGDKIVILGLNGSGKSTLLQALSTYLSLNEGTIVLKKENEILDSDDVYKYISYASPYIELIEDFTLIETINYSAHFKPFINNFDSNKILELSGLIEHKDKFIHQFSSGMKQRLKLTLAILANCPILLLDEPTSNLDITVIDWYKNLINDYANQKTIIVCSNSIKEEYLFCTKSVNMTDFKV